MNTSSSICRLAIFAAFSVIHTGCGPMGTHARPGEPSDREPPQPDASEGVVRTSSGRVGAELLAEPEEIDRDGRVVLRVANRGDVELGCGRPVQVERWTGTAWVETEESRDTAWTMELIRVSSGRTELEQPWPFRPERRPEPGWYRFTKVVFAEDGSSSPVRLVIRARVLVRS